MRVRFMTGMALLCLVVVTRPIQAEEAKPGKPGVVVKLHSIADLVEDVKFLAKLNGMADQAEHVDGFVKAWAEPSGIDIKRPIGLYGNVGPAGIDSTVVVLVPIADEKAVLEKLEGFNAKADKGDDGIYTVQMDKVPVPIYLKFADKYAYVTAQDKGALGADKLIKAADFLPEGKGPTLSATVDISKIPEGLRKSFMAQLELSIAKEKDKKKPNESKQEEATRILVTDHLSEGIARVINEGGPLNVDFNVDRKTESISVQMTIAGKADSSLAKSIAGLAKVNSLFAGLHQANSAVSGSVYSLLPEKVREGLGTQIIDGIKKDMEKEKNPEIKKHAEALLEALAPSLKSGEIDVAVDLRGPTESKQYTIVGGIKIKDGAQVEKAARVLLNDVPEDKRAAIKLDVAKVGETAIHQVDPGKEMDAQARKIFGDGPVFVAARADALLFAFGDKAQDALKEEIGLTPKSSKPMVVEVSLARLAPLLANAKVNADFLKGLEKAYADNKDGLKITASLEGGEALKLRVDLNAKVLTFVVPRAGKARN